ncbi:MAG: hypothetical protein R3A11_01980 [Bdellovibrionota bacterium]
MNMYRYYYRKSASLTLAGIVLSGTLLSHCGSGKESSTGSSLSSSLPTITKVELNSSREIIVTWSKSMDSQSALTLSHYQLDQGLRVAGAKAINASGTQIALYTDKNMLPKKTTLSVDSVLDTQGKASSSISKEFTPTTKIVFVSQSSGIGKLSTWTFANGKSGIEAADSVCQKEAQDQGYTGTFLALLDDSTRETYSELKNDQGGWTRTDGVTYVVSGDDLKNDKFRRTTVNTDAEGNVINVGDIEIWTGLPSATNCNNWMDDTNTYQGTVARSSRSFTVGGAFTIANLACDNVRQLLCIQDGAGLTIPSSEPAAIEAKTIFTTSEDGNGNLTTWSYTPPPGTVVPNGVKRADSICNKLASDANLEGSFKALLATSTGTTTNPINRLISTAGPYVTVTGQKIADDLSQWSFSSATLDKDLISTLIEDENGLASPNDIYIIGNSPFSVASPKNCSNWTNTSSGNYYSSASPYTKGIGFLGGLQNCSQPGKIICVED